MNLRFYSSYNSVLSAFGNSTRHADFPSLEIFIIHIKPNCTTNQKMVIITKGVKSVIK